jgi:hypothetical protein
METTFISYSNKDRDFAVRLANDLSSNAINIFYDQFVTPGDSLVIELYDALKKAKYLVVVITPDYLKSQWTQLELNIALSKEAKGEMKIVPLLLKDCDLPPSLAGKTLLNFKDQYDEPLTKLIAALKGKKVYFETKGVRNLVDVEILKARNKEIEEALQKILQKPRFEKRQFSKSEKKECFIVMPFNEPDLNEVYEAVVKPAIETCGLVCKRGMKKVVQML